MAKETSKELFGIFELARRTGVPLDTLYGWLDKGIIKPVGKRVYRGRVCMAFNEKTVREVRVIRALRKVVSLQVLRKAAEILRSYGHNPFSQGTFLVIGVRDKVDIIKAKDGNFIELTGKYAGHLLLPLWEIGVESKN